jgi:hypothetical protein
MNGRLMVGSYKNPLDADQHVRIDRLSPVGNPFHIGIDGTREEVIEKYRIWLCNEYTVNYELGMYVDYIVMVLRKGKSVCLMCHCSPLPCHGDVLQIFIEALL